eukprot:PITA_22042
MPINISIKPGIVENTHIGVSYSLDEIRVYTNLFEEFCDVFAWSYEEISGIDLAIVVHKIPMYPNVKPVRQRLHPMHPRKVAAIKGEVEKLLKNSDKTTINFTPFYLVYGLEATLPIECEIPSLKLAIKLLPDTSPEEEQLLYLERLDETCHIVAMVIEAQKKEAKAQFDQTVSPRVFIEGDLVLMYDQANDNLGVGKFEPMWHGPYIVQRVLQKGAYELVDYEGNALSQPYNEIYLKKYYA